jgi:YidC/Oxa1 family membrane protein insertase
MRQAVTLAVILIALGIVAAVFFGQGRQPVVPPPPTPAVQSPAADPSAPEVTPEVTPEATPEPLPGLTPQAPSDAAAEAAPVVAPPLPAAAITPIEGLRVVASATPTPSEIGGVADKTHRMQVDISSYGAAIRTISLSDYFEDLQESVPYIVQSPVVGHMRADGQRESRFPFAARGVWINDRFVDLQSIAWEKHDEGAYRITVADAQGDPVLTIERRYRIEPGTYSIVCEQRLTSHSRIPLRVVWEQYGQGDVTPDEAAYMGDRRDLISGHFDPQYDTQRRFVYSDKSYVHRSSVIDKYPGSTERPTLVPYWPSDRLPDGAELVWLASVNRYFAAVVHRPLATNQALPEAALQSLFPAPDLEMIGAKNQAGDTRSLIFRLRSVPIDLAPGETRNLDLSFFAGPRKRAVFADQAQPYQRLGFDGLIRYNLGGPCAFCTFQWLANGLLGFLKGIHYVTRDWGIAIIVLVLVVRAILHPITKKAQVNMMRMGKQMQALQPEIEKLKKKYKDDNQAMQREMMQLYREKGINPASALGCLPMFLQTPIWIALYAMLYYAIELRHVPAFYDVFNRAAGLFGAEWHFLSDLSTADNFIKVFDTPRQIPLWFIHPNFQSINILPILMGVTFYFQQKLMSPPPANEQAAQTQKMMKWMTLLFPFMLYSAPSGLTLYILASTGAGIIDSLLVKKHVKKMEEAGTLIQPRKPSGFMSRIADAVAEKQKQIEAQKKQQAGNPRFKDRKR